MPSENLNLLIAFGAGLLSFLSPCVLPLVPVYLGHLAGSSLTPGQSNPGRKIAFAHALSFVLGFSIVFVALGASVGLIGYLLYDQLPFLRQVGGLLLVLMGLHLMGLLKLPFLLYERKLEFEARPRWGYLRSFLVGLGFSLGWTPCVGPILGGILLLASNYETVGQGAYLLSIYSLGLGLPFLVAGLTLEPLSRFLKGIQRYLQMVSFLSGLLLVVVGVLIFLNKLVLLNRYFDFFGLSAI